MSRLLFSSKFIYSLLVLACWASLVAAKRDSFYVGGDFTRGHGTSTPFGFGRFHHEPDEGEEEGWQRLGCQGEDYLTLFVPEGESIASTAPPRIHDFDDVSENVDKDGVFMVVETDSRVAYFNGEQIVPVSDALFMFSSGENVFFQDPPSAVYCLSTDESCFVAGPFDQAGNFSVASFAHYRYDSASKNWYATDEQDWARISNVYLDTVLPGTLQPFWLPDDPLDDPSYWFVLTFPNNRSFTLYRGGKQDDQWVEIVVEEGALDFDILDYCIDHENEKIFLVGTGSHVVVYEITDILASDGDVTAKQRISEIQNDEILVLDLCLLDGDVLYVAGTHAIDTPLTEFFGNNDETLYVSGFDYMEELSLTLRRYVWSLDLNQERPDPEPVGTPFEINQLHCSKFEISFNRFFYDLVLENDVLYVSGGFDTINWIEENEWGNLRDTTDDPHGIHPAATAGFIAKWVNGTWEPALGGGVTIKPTSLEFDDNKRFLMKVDDDYINVAGAITDVWDVSFNGLALADSELNRKEVRPWVSINDQALTRRQPYYPKVALYGRGRCNPGPPYLDFGWVQAFEIIGKWVFFAGRFDWLGEDEFGSVGVYNKKTGEISAVGGGLWLNDVIQNKSEAYLYAGQVNALTSVNGDYLVAGGLFSVNAEGHTVQNLAFYDLTGDSDVDVWQRLGHCNDQIDDMVTRGTRIFFVGRFTRCENQHMNYIGAVKFVIGRHNWETLGAGLANLVDNTVYGINGQEFIDHKYPFTLNFYQTNKLLVTGPFNHAGGLRAPGVAMWDTNADYWRPVFHQCESVDGDSCYFEEEILDFLSPHGIFSQAFRLCWGSAVDGNDVYLLCTRTDDNNYAFSYDDGESDGEIISIDRSVQEQRKSAPEYRTNSVKSRFRNHRKADKQNVGTDRNSFRKNTDASSFRKNADTSSFRKNADTSSFRKNADASSFRKNADTSSFRKNADTSSFRKNADASSFRKNADTSSFRKNADTSSFRKNADASSFRKNADTSSFRKNADASSFRKNGDTGGSFKHTPELEREDRLNALRELYKQYRKKNSGFRHKELAELDSELGGLASLAAVHKYNRDHPPKRSGGAGPKHKHPAKRGSIYGFSDYNELDYLGDYFDEYIPRSNVFMLRNLVEKTAGYTATARYVGIIHHAENPSGHVMAVNKSEIMIGGSHLFSASTPPQLISYDKGNYFDFVESNMNFDRYILDPADIQIFAQQGDGEINFDGEIDGEFVSIDYLYGLNPYLLVLDNSFALSHLNPHTVRVIVADN